MRAAVWRRETNTGTLGRRHKPDYWLFVLTALLLGIGLVVVYSISPGLASSQHISQNYFISKQLINVGLGLIAFAFAASFPVRRWLAFTTPLALVAVVASIVVLFTPLNEAYQAHRWISIGGFSFQVAELIKLALLLWLARFLTDKWRAGKLSDSRSVLQILFAVLVLIGVVVAKLQSDLGSAAVLVAMLALMAYAAGLPMKRLALIGVAIVLFLGLAISTSQYRRERLTAFLNPGENCQTTGYQTCQALISVGSGGLFGQGLGYGVQAYGYVPEASNDSIFAIMAEKFGFIGTSAIILLYGLFIRRLKIITTHTSDAFSRLVVVGVLAWFSTQVIINIGAMLGLLPLKGITLPLISQGGTSIVCLMAALGLVYQISRYTSYSEVAQRAQSEKSTNNSLDGRRLRRAYSALLSLAHALKKASKNCRVVYIGLKGEQLSGYLKERYQVFDAVYSVPAGKFRRYHGESLLSHLIDLRSLAQNARDFFLMLGGIGQARKILKQVRPDVVFSKGGFVAVPVGLAASLLRLPIVTHDSDTVPGLANKIVGRFAAVHATGMPASDYKYPKESIHYVGIPLDERIKPVTGELKKDFKKQLGLPADSLVLLVGGAGLGARDVNNKTLAIAADLLGLFGNLYIFHLSGQQHEKQVAEAYEAAAIDPKRVKVIGFTQQFYKYTGAADLIITRAGATTMAELAAQRKAVILIPAPQLTGGHQLKNAAELAKNHAAVVVDNDAPAEQLLKVVADTLADRTKRLKLADNLGELAKVDGADKLAELLLKVAAKE